MACEIDWCGMTWEAFATLAAGAAAVIGATIIGIKQTRILDSQNRLERLRLKSELFDKRYRVFVEFGVFLDIAATGPANEVQKVIEGTRQNVERSIFLFDHSVYVALSPLFELGQKQAITVDPTRSTTLQTARVNLYKTFEPWLKLDDTMLDN